MASSRGWTEGETRSATSARAYLYDQVPVPAHFEGEEHRGEARTNAGRTREVEGERGLADGGTRRDDDELTGMQTVGETVEILEASGHTDAFATVAADGLDLIEGVAHELRTPETAADGANGDNGDNGMMGMSGMGSMSSSEGGDVSYPFFLINGHTPNDPETFAARPGDRVRVRMINASADTIYTVALGGHQLIVTHTDRFPVRPVQASALRIGMG